MHHQFSPGTGHGPRRRTVERSSPLCVAPPTPVDIRRPQDECLIQKQNEIFPFAILGRSVRPFQGDAVEFQNNSSFGPWNSVEPSEASETSEAGLHLPLPLFANPVGSLADSYLSESLSRCRQPKSKRRKARHLPVKRLRSHIVRQGTCDGFSTGSSHTFLGHKVM